MSSEATGFLIWACLAMLGVIAFIGGLFVNNFLKMAKDINDIKIGLATGAITFKNLELKICELEKDIEELKKALWKK